MKEKANLYCWILQREIQQVTEFFIFREESKDATSWKTQSIP